MTSRPTLSHFVWHDCLTPDIDRALDFMGRLVHWNVLEQTWPNIGRYPIVKSDNGPIAGILEMPMFLQNTGVPPYWTGYVHVDLAFAEEAIPRLGGQMFTMPTRSAMGTSFVFTDIGGAVLAAYELSESFTVPSSACQSEFVWQRLYSTDHGKSADFYSELFNWQLTRDGATRRLFGDSSGELVGDMGSRATWVETDTWVYFLGVADVPQLIATIESQSGSVIEETTIQGRVAIVSKDSQGAVVGFVEWEKSDLC